MSIYAINAVTICILTAFSLYPINLLNLRFCFIHLKRSSINQRCLYRLAISRASRSKLLVIKMRGVSLSGRLTIIFRNGLRYFNFFLARGFLLLKHIIVSSFIVSFALLFIGFFLSSLTAAFFLTS